MNRCATASAMGVSDVLFVVFVILKMTDNVDWSWWVVFSPIFVALGLHVLVRLLTHPA